MACQPCPGSPLSLRHTRHAKDKYREAKSGLSMQFPALSKSMHEQQNNKATKEDLNSNFHFSESAQLNDKTASRHINKIPPKSHCKSFRRNTKTHTGHTLEAKNSLLHAAKIIFKNKTSALPAKSSTKQDVLVDFNNLSPLPTSCTTFRANRKDVSLPEKYGTHFIENKNTSEVNCSHKPQAPASKVISPDIDDSLIKPIASKVISPDIDDSLIKPIASKIRSSEINVSRSSTKDRIAAPEVNGFPPKTCTIASEELDNMSFTLTTNSTISAETNNLSPTPTTENMTSAETNKLLITPTTANPPTRNINAPPLPIVNKILFTNSKLWSTSTSHDILHHSPHKAVDSPGQASHFQSLPTIYAEDAQVSSIVTGRSRNRYKAGLPNDNADCNHRFQPSQEQNSRKISPSSLRYNFQRPFYTPNVRRKDIFFGELIGNGGFGKVYKGLIHGSEVAIKVVQKRRGSGIHREILQAERLAFSLNLRHENIVNILALNLCDGLRGDALIVMELASPLTLQSILDDHTKPVTQAGRLQFSLQISEALRYLHANEVAHLDVKPRNVLLTSDHTCKLADFGSLTRVQKEGPKEDTEYTQLLGTLPYRAPELMKGSYPSTKADIFSLGVTFWQMVTREVPHNGANPHWLIYQVTKNNKRPDIHDPGSDTIEVTYRDLYTSCWSADPKARPDADAIINMLSSLLQCVYEGTLTDVINRNNPLGFECNGVCETHLHEFQAGSNS